MSTDFKKRTITSFCLLLLLYLILSYDKILVYTLIVLGVLSAIEFNSLIKKIKINNFNLFIINLSFIFFVFAFCSIFLIFFNFIQLKIIIFSLLICCVGSDIGVFIFGKILKGPRLTKISPKKTISGSIGSFFFSLVMVPLFYNELLEYSLLYLIIITLLISLTSQVGDILISYLKRKAKVKDTSDILPGHGGFLDRIDGIIFALPIGILLFSLNL